MVSMRLHPHFGETVRCWQDGADKDKPWARLALRWPCMGYELVAQSGKPEPGALSIAMGLTGSHS